MSRFGPFPDPSTLLADDANMPSLLSLPLVAGIDPADARYARTRGFVLSPDNPYFYRGALAAGPGSPHTPVDHVWPIALAVAGLTTADRSESLRLLRTIAATTAMTTTAATFGFEPVPISVRK